MPTPSRDPLFKLTKSLVPLLSQSLEEQFSVFHVMRHGTHEKQYSNVFAWLLDAEGTHFLGDSFQRVLMRLLNGKNGLSFPETGYRVSQEVDTAVEIGVQDIADIVLRSDSHGVVIENYYTSDGHGHSYSNYKNYGARGERESVVVMLCKRHEPHRLINDWDKATIITYEEALLSLSEEMYLNRAWMKNNPRQFFFIQELIDHVVEGPAEMYPEEQIDFIQEMCISGEYLRYSQKNGAVSFAAEIAKYAERQLDENNKLLNRVRQGLADFSENQLRKQINNQFGGKLIGSIKKKYVGKFKSYVSLRCGCESDAVLVVGLVFGPTAAMHNEQLPHPIENPDFTRVYLRVSGGVYSDQDVLQETEVSLLEILEGLPSGDTRFLDAVLQVLPSDALTRHENCATRPETYPPL